MKGGNFTEFLDKLYYGEELTFLYNDITYFLQGWTEGKSTTLVLDIMDNRKFSGYFWQYTAPNIRMCADAFLNETLWNGKDFRQIQDDVYWLE